MTGLEPQSGMLGRLSLLIWMLDSLPGFVCWNFSELMFLVSEGASVEAKRDSSQEAENLLRTNPVLGLRKYKVLQLDLSGTTVDEEFDAVDKAGIAGGGEKSDRRDLQ
jgi:hypothetical protein